MTAAFSRERVRTHVDRDGMTAADPFDFPLLQHAQQRDLRLGGQVADFIEEHGAAVGGLEPSQASLQCAREGALFVTEELGRNEGLWYGRAVHPDERLRSPSRPLVNSARDELLAGTGFAKDEDGRIGRGDLGHLDQHRSQGCGRAHDLFKHRGAIDVFAQRKILALRALFGPLAIVGGQDDDGLSDGIEDLTKFERGGAHQTRYTQAWSTRKTGALRSGKARAPQSQ
jgi:hypothetical protein